MWQSAPSVPIASLPSVVGTGLCLPQDGCFVPWQPVPQAWLIHKDADKPGYETSKRTRAQESPILVADGATG